MMLAGLMFASGPAGGSVGRPRKARVRRHLGSSTGAVPACIKGPPNWPCQGLAIPDALDACRKVSSSAC